MEKSCVFCNGSMENRYHNAKYCFYCEDNIYGYGQRKAMAEVARAIKKGKLKSPKEFDCVDCGKPAICYDHRDYNKPLEVVPVCSKCNHKRGLAIPLDVSKIRKKLIIRDYPNNEEITKKFLEYLKNNGMIF